jgi:hypothetical protein
MLKRVVLAEGCPKSWQSDNAPELIKGAKLAEIVHAATQSQHAKQSPSFCISWSRWLCHTAYVSSFIELHVSFFRPARLLIFAIWI